MSGLSNVDRENYSKYDRMSTEALAELLRLDIQAPEEESLDIDAILYITEVIAKREEDDPSGLYPVPDVDAAWEAFQTKYRPYQTDGRSLYDFDDSSVDKPDPAPAPPLERKHRRGLRWLGRIAAIAAVLLVALTATAYAMGYDLWNVVAKWGRDTFTFVSEVNPSEVPNADITVPTNQVEYDSLQAALDAYGITTPLAPTWIPDGLSLEDVVVVEGSFNGSIRFQASYIGGERYLTIYINTLRDNSGTDYSMWEKDDTYTNEIEIGGTTFYMIENAEDPLLVWWNGSYEGCISGNLQSDELISIAKSIYERL